MPAIEDELEGASGSLTPVNLGMTDADKQQEPPISRGEKAAFYFLSPLLTLLRFGMVLIFMTFYYYGTEKSIRKLAARWVGDENTVAEDAISGAMYFWAFDFVVSATFNGALPKLSVEGSFSHLWNRTLGLLFHRFKSPDRVHRIIVFPLLLGHVLNIMFWSASGARLYLLLLGEWINPDGPSLWGNGTTPSIAHIDATDLSSNFWTNLGCVLFTSSYTFTNVLWSGSRLIEGTANVLEEVIRRCQKRISIAKDKPENTFVGDPDKDYWPALTQLETRVERKLRRIMHGTRQWKKITPSDAKVLERMRDFDQGFTTFSQAWYYWGAMTETVTNVANVMNVEDPSQAGIQAFALACGLNTTTVALLFYIKCRPDLPVIGNLPDVLWRRFYVNYPKDEKETLASYGKTSMVVEMQSLSEVVAATDEGKVEELAEPSAESEDIADTKVVSKQKPEKNKKPESKQETPSCDCANVASVIVMSVYCLTMLGTVTFQAMLLLRDQASVDRPGEFLVNDGLAGFLTWVYLNPYVTLVAIAVREGFVLTPKALNSYEKFTPYMRQFIQWLKSRPGCRVKRIFPANKQSLLKGDTLGRLDNSPSFPLNI